MLFFALRSLGDPTRQPTPPTTTTTMTTIRYHFSQAAARLCFDPVSGLTKVKSLIQRKRGMGGIRSFTFKRYRWPPLNRSSLKEERGVRWGLRTELYWFIGAYKCVCVCRKCVVLYRCAVFIASTIEVLFILFGKESTWLSVTFTARFRLETINDGGYNKLKFDFQNWNRLWFDVDLIRKRKKLDNEAGFKKPTYLFPNQKGSPNLSEKIDLQSYLRFSGIWIFQRKVCFGTAAPNYSVLLACAVNRLPTHSHECDTSCSCNVEALISSWESGEPSPIENPAVRERASCFTLPMLLLLLVIAKIEMLLRIFFTPFAFAHYTLLWGYVTSNQLYPYFSQHPNYGW